MVANPAGYQIIYDGGCPNIISGKAREAVSGGWLVAASGGVVSSGANSFNPQTDLLFAQADVTNFTGVVLAKAGSNETISVATKGAFLITCANTTSAGQPVVCNGANAVVTISTGSLAATQYPIGRSLTVAGSEGYALVEIGRS